MLIGKHLKLVLFTLFLTIPFTALAQNESENKGVTGVDINFNSTLSGFYYQDAISSITEGRLTQIDGSIDINEYILGPNDIVTLTIDANKKYVLRALLVNNQGDIIVPQLGTIHVDGKSIAEATELINNIADEYFNDPVTNLSLEFAKSNSVHILGGVPYPGKYNLPPFSRIDEALYYAIFQNKISSSEEPKLVIQTSDLLSRASELSLRNIEITHQNGNKSKADLISYFKAGKLSDNPLIQLGDQIRVRPLTNESPRISISGAVHTPQEFEYTYSDQIPLLIEIADGYLPEADTTRLFVYRSSNGETSQIELSGDEFSDYDLQPNDRIIVPTKQKLNQAASAWISGEVNIPGNFPIKSGVTNAFELLNMAGDVTEDALPSAAYLLRGRGLENEIPNKFNTELMKRTSNQVMQGFEYLELETRLSQNKVFIDLTDEEQLKQVEIFDGDRLYIPRDENTIFVFGQVNNPGYYPFTDSNQSVQNYVNRAGGFALSADHDRIFIIKAGSGTWYNPSEVELKSGDRIFIDRKPYEELNAKRTYEIQKQQVRNTRIQLIMTGISTITGIITTYVAITR